MKALPPNLENMTAAASALQSGKLVGMPTETVYGIAANAFDETAVHATFEAKGRPPENPLIVHIGKIDQLSRVAREFPKKAQLLADAFWPGPLTLVVPKMTDVPAIVTAGLDTVAIRMPVNLVARRLINRAGTPLSAPSANKFMGLSPTTAQMIDPQILEHLDCVIDDGPCTVGIESTVLDLSTGVPTLLRPGAVTRQQIEALIGEIQLGSREGERKSPGMYPKHYAPKTPVILVEQVEPHEAGLILRAGSRDQIEMPNDAKKYAQSLYGALHKLDQLGLRAIYVEAPPQGADWIAVWDRLLKIVSH